MCVTGASGYLASWLIMRLLQLDYTVRGTLRDLDDATKTQHLLSLPGANEKLQLVEADVLDEESMCAAVDGCDGVFSVATPMPDPADDQGETIEPMITGALNVLKACAKASSVKRVVMTSTFFAALQTATSSTTQNIDESDWPSVEYWKEKRIASWGYMVGKVEAERAAFDFAKKNNIDLVTILPSLVGGPCLLPSLPTSDLVYLAILKEEVSGWMLPILRYMSYVHIEDVAMAHILLMEEPKAKGRYLCSATDASLKEVADIVENIFKSRGRPPSTFTSSIEEIAAPYKISTDKLQRLGFVYKYNTLERILEDALHHFVLKGHLREN